MHEGAGAAMPRTATNVLTAAASAPELDLQCTAPAGTVKLASVPVEVNVAEAANASSSNAMSSIRV